MRWPGRKRGANRGVGLTIHWGLFRYVRPHWRPLLVALIGMAGGVALSLAGPWPMKIFLDNVVGHHHTPGWIRSIADLVPGLGARESLLVVIVVASLLIFVLGMGTSALEQIAGVRLNQRMTYDLAGDLFSHLQRLSPVYHSRRPTGDTIARVTGDPSCVEVFVTGAALPLLQNVVTMIAMFAIMFTLQPVLTLLALVVTPFMLLTIRPRPCSTRPPRATV
jgi:ATP-binding cassette, subfamily B, bacterial